MGTTLYLSESTYPAAAPPHHVDRLERIPHVVAGCVIEGPPLHVLGQPEHLLGYAAPHAHIGGATADMCLVLLRRGMGVGGGVHQVGVVGRGVGCEGLVGDRLILDDADVLHENARHGETI